MGLGPRDACLRQHLDCGEDGALQMRKKAMKLSVDDQEISYYIRCRNPSDNADQPVDLVACPLLDVPFSHDCIAILRSAPFPSIQCSILTAV